MSNQSNDFAIITKTFDDNVKKSFRVLYGELIDSLVAFCGQTNVQYVNDCETVEHLLNERKKQYNNKNWLVINCPAYFDVSDYIKTIVPNISSGVKIALLKMLIEFGATIVVDGYRIDEQGLNEIRYNNIKIN